MQKNISFSKLQLKNNLILAPMAGITDLPYRLIMKEFGAGLVFTEMVSANGLIRDGVRTRELLRSTPEERPLGIQLFADSPDVLARAAAMVSQDGELIDINMGCPVKKVVRSGAGSALLQNPILIGKIVAAVRKATPLPLTVKIRSGWDQQTINYLEVGRIAEEEGADGLVLHPRTRSQGFSGHSEWQHIRRLKEQSRLPVIGSGDIFSAADALSMLKKTGCDGIMIGRGGYGNPWLFKEIAAALEGAFLAPPSAEERLRVALKHLDLFVDLFGSYKAVMDMRKHLCWYVRGLNGAAHFRQAINKTGNLKDMKVLLESFLATNAEGVAD
ncbi:tRNA dihydrouridine synthase DusB [Desulfuromonas sp. KJ2020]|uniref:tRNA dihydrouridine synthase DusB n=1 Tax=Desulfuromonas sp. KJ2020 TaxID=2919173 RepID=UPI0020A78CFB|nr:tRNA dihydrouridine synthase DusB [Desulfuromonas sp. KJ2020]MCP3177260.1 tRNA dihydrouridine synthase DusB [Desulfuromonas sp. KJ2020]